MSMPLLLRTRGERIALPAFVAGLIGLMLALSPSIAFAQTGIFSVFQRKEAPASPYADAEDDHATWVATGAPLMIRPPEEAIARAPRPSNLPLPPRRPGTESTVAAGNQARGGSPVAPPGAPSPGAPSPAAIPSDVAPVVPQETPAPAIPDDHPAQSGDGPMMRQYAALPPEGFRPSLPTLVSPGKPEPATPEEIEQEERSTPEPNYVEKQTDYVNIRCLKPELMAIMNRAGQHFGGKPIITSGQRDRGRRGSYHRRCMAADFFIEGVERTRLASWLRNQRDAGGVGTYCHTKSVHIDIGDPRNWWQCGRRFRFAQR